MYTKSIIQQHLEQINSLTILQESLQDFMDKYTVEDGVFGLFNNKMYELTCGYLVKEHEYDTLEECIRNMNPKQVIRVQENKKFTVGGVVSSLQDCPQECTVVDIEFLEEINRY